ncbi:MAG: protein kinase [Gemmatimonadetes bacterium]|nr:protein kinase [Gemmatimonadota bacterium]
MPSLLDRLQTALAPHFTVERELASGGMGTVFLGRDVALDKPVAIKILRPELATARATERFLREARILAGLRHPHIVPVHRADQADGIFYYIMDYLVGETLADRLARGRVPADEVVRLARDLLSALEVAHRRGVVHRDIKPSNIIFDDHSAVLTDFGIAKTLTDPGTALTVPGQPVGTLEYMPPEQAAGGEVTPRTDLYAVAMVLYEAVTGRPWSILDRPETADWSGVPRRLALALRRALAWSPEDRWPDAAAFMRALWARRAPAPAAVLKWLLPVGAAAVITYLIVRPAPLEWDLAIPPLLVTSGAGASLGEDIAEVTRQNLARFDSISLAPSRKSIDSSRVRYWMRGSVAQRGDTLVVQFEVLDARSRVKGGGQIVGDDKWAIGGEIAFKLIEVLRPDLVKYYGRVPPPTRSVQALNEFLAGDRDFRTDRWRQAEAHLQEAVALDSNFALAQWRLWNVQLWRRIPRTVDLQRLRQHREQLSAADSLLIAAERASPGAERLAKYAEAVARDPGDDYARLLYASELFHRGPLTGVPLDSSIVILERIIETRATLAPAHDQLIWGLIRLGRGAAAESALARLQSIPHPENRDIDPRELLFVYQARFSPTGPGSLLRQILPELVAKLFDRTRLGLAFDVPEAELQVGTLLAGSPRFPPPRRADGHVAMGLALETLGRPQAALPHFDSAAALFGTPSAALQAAQWRVVPGAMGLPGPAAAEVERGRRTLEELARAGPVAVRAAWTLALDAFGRGDVVGARPWRSRVRDAAMRDARAGRLDVLLQGFDAAATGDAVLALRITAPLDRHEDWGRLSDAFERSVLHLERAEWQSALGNHPAADSTRLWHENADFDGWLNGDVQAAEVDWVLGMHARRRLAMDAIGRGDLGRGCPALRRVLEIWSQPEPGFAPLVEEARRAVGRCPE